MPIFPPFGKIRRQLPLVAGALVLTQVPAVPLLLLGGKPTGIEIVAYAIGSVAACLGVVAVGLAWWERIERVVSLVRSYAEEGRLPSATKGHPERGAVLEVRASLNSLDQALRSLENEAARDPLTGILNRRTCSARLEGDLARSARSGVPFSIAIFDMDDLKSINDSHGHAAGDSALRHFAKTLGEATREGDWVARWGGDEFVLGLWDANGDSVLMIANRVIECLNAAPAVLGEKSVVLSASFGVAQAQEGDDPTLLFSRADKALLVAKGTGRGRVSTA